MIKLHLTLARCLVVHFSPLWTLFVGFGLLYFFLSPSKLKAQDSLQPLAETTAHTSLLGGFAKRPSFGRPFWADMHSTIIRGEVALATTLADYNLADDGAKQRAQVFGNVGVDIPIWSGNLKNLKFGLSFSLPFIIHLWMDAFEGRTSPVLNTDYRIGMPEIAFIHRFPQHPFFKNYSIKWAPLKHESTHIGDELTVYRMETAMPITRVNVSYNYSEVILTLNEPEDFAASCHSFRVGLMVLLAPSKGWYSLSIKDNPHLADSVLLQKLNGSLHEDKKGNLMYVANTSPFEAYFQYQYQTRRSKKSHLQGVFSAELRSRMSYGYPYYVANPETGTWHEAPDASYSDRRVYTANFWVGLRYSNPKIAYFSRIGIGCRAYFGNNPYGQFRAIPSFHQYGFSLLFE